MLVLADRVYCLLLYAYPAPFRRDFGNEMAQTFRDDCRATVLENGVLGLVGLWCLMLADLFQTAFAEHRGEFIHMPMEKIQRLGGPAAIIGGAIWAIGTAQAILTIAARPGHRAIASDARLLITIMLITLPMFLLALLGLYWRMPDRSQTRSRLSFGLALLGLIFFNIGMIVLFATPDYAEFTTIASTGGFYGIMLGIAGMGLIILSKQALGRWSVVPLLLPLWCLIAMVYSVTTGETGFDGPVVAFVSAFGVCWLLLGVALVSTFKQEMLIRQPA